MDMRIELTFVATKDILGWINSMKVFISHSQKDAEIAKELTSRLSDAGLDVWLAEREVMPGDNWPLETGKALQRRWKKLSWTLRGFQWVSFKKDYQVLEDELLKIWGV
jgi:hypothetical protein